MSDKPKYRITLRCGCGKEFKKVTTDSRYSLLDENSHELQKLLKDVECPSCKKKDSDRRFRVGDGLVSDEDIVEHVPVVSVDKYSCNSCSKIMRFYAEYEGDKLGHCHHCGSQDVKYIGYASTGIIAQSSQNMIKAVDATAKMTMETYGMTDINMGSNMRVGDTCTPKLPPIQQNMADAMFDHSKSKIGVNMNQIGKKAMAGAYADPNNPVANLHKSKMKPKFDIINAPPVNVKTGAKLASYDRMLTKAH